MFGFSLLFEISGAGNDLSLKVWLIYIIRLPVLPVFRRSEMVLLVNVVEVRAGRSSPLLESFSALKEEFVDDPAILGSIDHEIKLAREWIALNMDDEPEEDRPARTFGDVDSPHNPPAQAQSRGIFDDIDE